MRLEIIAGVVIGLIHGLGVRDVIPAYGNRPDIPPWLRLLFVLSVLGGVVSVGASWFGAFAFYGVLKCAQYLAEALDGSH